MRIFISWSGERSQSLALALKDWVPLVLHYADPWFSTFDIKSGDRWNLEVAKGLQESKFGIICLTRDNLEAPWLLFESGALAKSMEDGRVIPLRLDLEASDITGPLTQFQSERADESGVRRLIQTLNSASSTPVSDERVAQVFSLAWERLRERIEAIPAPSSTQRKSRPQAEILEELVSGVRSVEMRLREASEDDPFSRRGIRREMDPMLMHMISREVARPGDPIKILMMAGIFREDFPWLYEMASEAYREIKTGDAAQAKLSLDRFANAVHMLRRGPILEMNTRNPRAVHVAIRQMEDFLQEFIPSTRATPRKIVRKPPLVSSASDEGSETET